MVVNIWYDVSDVADGGEPHLSGTRRITVGSLGGLTTLGVRCRLVRFDRRRQAFVAVAASELPETIRRHLPWLASERPEDADDLRLADHASRGRPSAAEEPASDPATQRLWQSSREFCRAGRDLGRAAVRWVKSRLRPRPHAAAEPVATVPVSPGITRPLSTRSDGGDEPFTAGDVLLSLGATWEDRGHADAVAQVRRRGVRTLRMIHDLMPTFEAQWVAAEHVGPITTWTRRLLTDSDHVFTISEFTSREIVRFCEECGFRRPGMSVVRPGDVLEATAAAEPPPLPRFVPQRPFFACVSTIDARSNHRLLHDTWRQLAARDPADCPDLVCIGSPRPGSGDLLRELTADRLVNGRIHLLDGVDDRELAWYYRHCLATIHPSRYDGWAVAVAESLGQGRIPLASDATSIPEISADLPEFFEPHDVRRLAELVDRVRHDTAWREGREDLIRRTFRATAWTDTAARLMDVVQAVGSRRNIAA
jgi:glycosyltransferase involved in cell wall biosynthesis